MMSFEWRERLIEWQPWLFLWLSGGHEAGRCLLCACHIDESLSQTSLSADVHPEKCNEQLPVMGPGRSEQCVTAFADHIEEDCDVAIEHRQKVHISKNVYPKRPNRVHIPRTCTQKGQIGYILLRTCAPKRHIGYTGEACSSQIIEIETTNPQRKIKKREKQQFFH